MELIDIGACLIENAAGFALAWLLLSKRGRNILPLIAAIAAGTALKFAFYNVSVLAGYLITAAIFSAGNMFLFKDKTGRKAAVSLTAAYLFCISDFIFGCAFALILGKAYSHIGAEWLLIKAMCSMAILPFFLFLRKIPQKTPSKFFSFFAGTMAGFGIVAAVVTGAFRGSAMNTSRDNMIAAAVVALLFYGVSIIVAGFFSELCIGLNREQKLLLLESNYKYFSEQIDIRKENERTLRKFRHDILNYLIDIRGLLAMNQTDSALKLLEETAGKAELPNPELINTGNVFADVVISSKSAVCKRKSIRFEYKAAPMNEYKIEAADISSLLSNLLDNAVEASEKSTDPYIKLDIFEHNIYLIFRVENSIFCDVKPDNFQLRSTKEDSSLHGCGMEIIREIAEKYNGNFIWKSGSKRFTATVLIRK